MKNMKGYQNVQVMTADRVRLVIMLYEGALRFNRCAQAAIEKNDVQGRSRNINRAIEIISELSNSLNIEEGGEIADNLLRLYQFSIEQLSDANSRNDGRPIEAVNRVLNELKAGWEHIASERSRQIEAEKPRSSGLSYGG